VIDLVGPGEVLIELRLHHVSEDREAVRVLFEELDPPVAAEELLVVGLDLPPARDLREIDLHTEPVVQEARVVHEADGIDPELLVELRVVLIEGGRSAQALTLLALVLDAQLDVAADVGHADDLDALRPHVLRSEPGNERRGDRGEESRAPHDGPASGGTRAWGRTSCSGRSMYCRSVA
jgi:hypothetical protein